MIEFIKNSLFWRNVRDDIRYKPLLDELFNAYDRFCKEKDIPVLKFSEEMEYFRNGNRKHFEDVYFLRREQMTVYALMSLIYPENEEYLIKLQDVICAICSEYSWQVPAHRPTENRNKNDGHSLFAAETGFYIAELKRIFENRFDPCVVERMTEALEKKILSSYEGRITGVEWKNITNNWAAVCAGSIGLAFMYESPERFEKIKPRVEKCMENYLLGISEDGGTEEGTAYWNYGICFYMMYYEALKRFTNGKDVQGLEHEKIKKFAGFFTSTFMDKDVMASFADSSSQSGCHYWVIHFLKNQYDIIMPPRESAFIDFRETASAIRAFLFYNPQYVTDELENSETYYKELGWYIKRDKNYSFATKSGRNVGPHHHNDVGSFIVSHNNKQVLCDLGSPEYTAENFGEKRYEIINNSALGHNIPIVNGIEQQAGEEYFGTMKIDDGICIDIATAYSTNPKKLIRRFDFTEEEIRLTDSFEYGLDITERFVTEIVPVIEDKKIILDKTELLLEDGWQATYKQAVTTYHSGEERTVFLIDVNPQNKTDEFKMTICFEQ